MRKVSLRDIAAQAGVSPTTVSFVINGKAREMRVSRDVIQRIEALIKKLNYQPNSMARGLRTGKTGTIGLMVEDISNHFFATLARVIEDEADYFGYDVVYCSTENKEARAQKLLETLTHRQVDGYILTPTPELDVGVQKLLQGKKSLVLMDRYFPSLNTNFVGVDNLLGASMAASHLLAQGYQKIALVTTSSSQIQMQERVRGFTNTVNESNIALIKQVHLRIPFEKIKENAVGQIIRFLIKHKPDAVFFTTNYLGICGLEAIKSLGWAIPSQIGVVSFDDHIVFRLYEPAITCVAQPIMEIGKYAVKALIQDIQKKDPDVLARYVLKPQLIVRKSC
ncbi:MAG: LacI family transcriptional regulator [Chitinophagaceae bacterium]|nr:MAG: LacI family transcriptional regulator [Chitinophagaceae bacterium]